MVEDPTLIQNPKDIWDNAIDSSNVNADNFLEIQHDIHYQTVYTLAGHRVTSLFRQGCQSVTVGQCMGGPEAKWHRAGPGGLISGRAWRHSRCGGFLFILIISPMFMYCTSY